MIESNVKTPDGLDLFHLDDVGMVVSAVAHNKVVSKLNAKINELQEELSMMVDRQCDLVSERDEYKEQLFGDNLDQYR